MFLRSALIRVLYFWILCRVSPVATGNFEGIAVVYTLVLSAVIAACVAVEYCGVPSQSESIVLVQAQNQSPKFKTWHKTIVRSLIPETEPESVVY